MAQFAVFVVNAVPAVGATTHALVYRGDHLDEAAAVAAGASALGLAQNVKVWAVPLVSLTSYRVDVAQTRNVVLE